jgi:rare lipoprotein A (peptidoglycan hydrolase)
MFLSGRAVKTQGRQLSCMESLAVNDMKYVALSAAKAKLPLIVLALFSFRSTANPCQPTGSPPAGAVMASWYGKEHHGQITANGRKFDEHELTAAHPTLPLNTYIRVENLANGKSVGVTITDRGPGYGRGVDLSEGAAEILGMRRCGLALVLVTSATKQR